MTIQTKKALILGAGGQIARWAVDMLGDRDDVAQTLYMRTPAKLGRTPPANARLVQGDVMDAETLKAAMAGQDVVYANLSGDMDAQAEAVVAAMKATGVKKLIFVASLGVYDEVPAQFGEWNRREIGAYLPPYRRAADIVEASGLDYAVLRPAWLTDADEVAFETTTRDEPFKGTIVSRKSVAALAVDLILNPERITALNLGVNKPNTDGDAPDLQG
ncbi:SDR family oxidoreductase [Brevundimonas diminuta]|uniref:SDR family oxidoreductase n=1 Tax=Brevundimonas diminuta TaxID=293 RepID=UPI003D0611FB